MIKLIILIMFLTPSSTHIDYNLTIGNSLCPKGSYYTVENKCEWFDWSEKEDLDFTDAVLVAQIRYNCPYRTKDFPTEEFARFLLQIEREAGFPPEVRGLLAAFACKESGYRFNAKGDHKFSDSGKHPKARGMYQLWGWARKHVKTLYENDLDRVALYWWKRVPLKDYRLDPVYSSIYVARHIANQIKSVKKDCKTNNVEKIWRIAEARVARGGKKLRCRDKTSHYKLMKKWHKIANSYEYY